MTPLNPPLTKEDFHQTPWQSIIDNCERKECLCYRMPFWKESKQAEELGNVREQKVFAILALVTSFEVKPKEMEEFTAGYLKNLTENRIEFLTEIASEISDPELQARVTDILWVKQRNYRMALLAIPAYLQSANSLEDPEKWNSCFARIERALRLAYKINNKKEDVSQHIETVLNRYQGQDPLLLSPKLMELLQEHGLGEPDKYATLAETAANFAEGQSDWRKANMLWNIKAIWHRMEEEDDKERVASMAAAETYVKEAESAIQQTTSTSYIMASRCLQQAIEAFRAIRGTQEETRGAKERAEEIHSCLLQYQEKTNEEMITHSQEVDITELVVQAKNYVRGKEFHEAILALALLGRFTNVAQLKQEVRRRSNEYLFSHLFPIVKQNEAGKIVARQPGSILSDDPDEAEAATRFAMCHDAVYHYEIQARAYIEPAKYQINMEHAATLDDVFSVIYPSPFIPPNREYLYVKGIYAGLTGDFFTSTHILIPQIENSVRYVMWQRGIITSGLDSSGIQNEHNLNTTLYHPEINKIFDEDTLFDLQCLLVEHAGSNLRNRMAHGLMNDGEFMKPLMSYVWWLTLRLCCLPIIRKQ
ncbi:MAG: DUF4209 domain-containing protein [Cyanobacteria bacterium P01_C01_bin.121]